jgi:hypothetical protein
MKNAPPINVEPHAMTRLSSLLLPILAALILSSCGTSFQNEWKNALSQKHHSDSIEGPWQGTWTSSFNGHTGKLRCVIGPEKPDHTREFSYYATWGKIFSGCFHAVHEVTERNGVTTMHAQHDIGKRGTFHAEGTISPTKFSATYRAMGDHGALELKRPN